jgi:hypothetical protein
MAEMNEQQVAEHAKDFPNKWYRHWAFPLLPHIRVRQADQWNTKGIHFTWLFFRFWTLDAPNIGIDAEIDTHHIGAYIRLPYCKMGVGLHVPYRIAGWLQRKTWRHAKGMQR